VSPQLIIALGNPALRSLTGTSGVTKHRGSLLTLSTEFESPARVLATAHPAAGLRYPHFVEQIREDFGLLKRTLEDDFVEIDIPWKDAPHAWGAIGQLNAQIVAFDLETNARETRDPFTGIYLCGVDDGSDSVTMFERVKDANTALYCAERVVGHNSSRFDRLHLRTQFGGNLRCDDTMLMGWCLHEEWGQAKKLNLESLCVAELGVRPWKKDVTWDWRQPATIPEAESKQYCARDTRLTRQLYFAFEKKLKDDAYLWRFYDRLLLPASRALADMEERGLYINNKNVEEATVYYEAEAQRHLDTINAIAAFEGMENFNVRSTKQMAELLFERIGFDPVAWTDHGAASTNVGALKTLRERLGPEHENAPIFDAVLQYRKCWNKMLRTYIKHFREQQDPWCMVYPWYSLVNTATGRTSGDYQQIPREPRIRRCVGAPPGKVMLSVDFSQLEMRTAASRYVFDEPNLRAAFERGDDVHLLLASEITRKPIDRVTKEERSRAKPPNFLFLYGGEEDMYIRTLLEDYDIVKSRQDAQHERDAFFRRWNMLPVGHQRVVQNLERDGYIRTAFGTLRRLPNVYADDRRIKVEAYRQAVNVVDQAPSAHIALTGLVLINAAGYDVRSFQHDAYLVYVDDNEGAVRSACEHMRYLLEQGVPQVMRSQFGLEWDVPLKVDITAGTAWTDDDRQEWVPT
jgi:DNA polymerase I-like protein with 3'-5' exonuclease and polymerase domains